MSKNPYMYVETVVSGNPAYQFDYATIDIPPVGYTTAVSVQEFKHAFDLALFDPSNYRRWRGAMKYYIVEVLGGGNEDTGFAAIPTAELKTFAAIHNIGTAQQRMAAITNIQKRDAASYNFIVRNEGVSGNSFGQRAIRETGIVWAKALLYSRCDHILCDLGGGVYIPFPSYVFMKLQITPVAPNEIQGDLTLLYRMNGLDGIALGDGLVGISDFLSDTVATRYAPPPAGGGGLTTDPIIIDAVDAAILAGVGIDGYTGTSAQQLEQFQDELMFIIMYGKPSYGQL